MSQLVFIHGPGAGGCREGYAHQLEHFPGSLAPNLPGHLEGRPCADVQGYTEWVRGWLWGHDLREDLVLVGFTLGACIALQYALDYPEEVSGLVLMTVAMRPKERGPGTLEMRLRAAENPEAHETWLRAMDHAMMFIDPELRERLLEWHRQVSPISQHDDLVVIDRFDVRDRIHTLQAPSGLDSRHGRSVDLRRVRVGDSSSHPRLQVHKTGQRRPLPHGGTPRRRQPSH